MVSRLIEPGSASTLVELQSVADGRYGETLKVIWEVEPGRAILPAGSTGRCGRPVRPAGAAGCLPGRRALVSGGIGRREDPSVTLPRWSAGGELSAGAGSPSSRVTEGEPAPCGRRGLGQDHRGRPGGAGVAAAASDPQGHGGLSGWVDGEVEGRDGREVRPRLHRHRYGAVRKLRPTHGSAANPFRVYPLSIVSLPWLRGPKGQRLLDEVLTDESEDAHRPPFGLLILDEADHVAPAAPKQVYAVDSQQTKLLRRMAPYFEHRLFLSATPHNGYQQSFTALLELVDDQKFARGVEPDQAALKETVVRRLKTQIVDENGNRKFHERQVMPIAVEYPDDERALHAQLTAYAELRKNRVKKSPRGGKAADLVTLLLKKRFFSSPDAFATTVGVYLETLKSQAGKKKPAHRGSAKNSETLPRPPTCRDGWSPLPRTSPCSMTKICVTPKTTHCDVPARSRPTKPTIRGNRRGVARPTRGRVLGEDAGLGPGLREPSGRQGRKAHRGAEGRVPGS